MQTQVQTQNRVQAQQTLLCAIQGKLGADSPPASTLLRALPGVRLARGLAAYRGHAQALAERVLAGAYPRVKFQLGLDSFTAMAWAFWRARPPGCGDLGRWGEALPEFLAAQKGMDLWLCDVARMEWAVHLAQRAADSVLNAVSLDLLHGHDPEALRLTLRPGLALLRVAPMAAACLACPAPSGRVLVWRCAWQARCAELDAGSFSFMAAIQAGQSLHHALLMALEDAPDFDFSQYLQRALQDGWLQSVDII
ncbi:HvfC/BufC family peptide modification chaperone [Roseateles koreensis]|uniref:DNA-binding domain-containing protein n=1 Tax=Roseateles koreensis TaxID=2987526 RepID=A0ABT5KQ11_9BURK|nr:putative DNA-binding domain-containing protein [Roseateles koreensis]MDC8784463.1 putative DNA-binding domain-containing protein [Roseateles koreensis]